MAVFRKHYSPAKALIQFQHCYLDILSSCFTPNLFCKDSVRKWTNWPLFNHQLLLPNSCPRPQKIDPDNCDYWQGIDRVILESNDQSVPWHATYCTLDRELGKKCLGRILLESKTLRRPNLLRQGFRTMQSVVKKIMLPSFNLRPKVPPNGTWKVQLCQRKYASSLNIMAGSCAKDSASANTSDNASLSTFAPSIARTEASTKTYVKYGVGREESMAVTCASIHCLGFDLRKPKPTKKYTQ